MASLAHDFPPPLAEDTVLQGDCLDLLRTLPDQTFDAVITDPPYGINFQSNRRIDKTLKKKKIANDTSPFIWWLYDAFRVTKEGGALLCFCEWSYQDVFRMAIEVAGYTLHSQVIWDKDWHGMGDLQSAFAPSHELIWFATKGKFAFPNGRPKSVLRARKIEMNTLVHPNEKPIPLMRTLCRAVTPFSGSILDPFAGSGATLLAAKQEGYHFLGMELEETYVTLAKNRLAALSMVPLPHFWASGGTAS